MIYTFYILENIDSAQCKCKNIYTPTNKRFKSLDRIYTMYIWLLTFTRANQHPVDGELVVLVHSGQDVQKNM